MKLRCVCCGASAEAACDCGVGYMPAGEFAAKAVAENPSLSDRAIAVKFGIAPNTVSRARESTAPNGAVEKRTGLDGKARKLPQRRKLTDDIAQIALAALHDGKTRREAADLAGISEGSVEIAKATEAGRVQGRAEAEIDPSLLALSAQEKLDSAIRQHKRKLDIEFDQRLQAAIKEAVEEAVLPQYQKESDEAQQIIKSRKGIMTRKMYRLILSWLHPDRVTDPASKIRITEAFNEFRKIEIVLCNEQEMPTAASDLPRTYAEMMKRREEVQARRRRQKHQSNELQTS